MPLTSASSILVEEDAMRLHIEVGDTAAVGILVAQAHTAARQNALHENIDGRLHPDRIDPVRFGVEDIGRWLLDADDAPALLEDLPRRFRQGGQKLGLGGVEIGQKRRRLEPAGKRQRDQQRCGLAPGERHRRLQIVAREPVAALHPTLRLHRNAERHQAVDVAVDGAHRHLEPLGELAGAALSPTQQQQDAQRPFDRVHAHSRGAGPRCPSPVMHRPGVGASHSVMRAEHT
jgi:hypothetical protein